MYQANENRYLDMLYRRCGRSGLNLPVLSLGLWQNFGTNDSYTNARQMVLNAFDMGITYFDLANNYGPPPGSAEKTFGRILKEDLSCYRDEIIVSTKAGYTMWPGPYGDWGSRKYLVASLEQSLKRMELDYVDIFYHHRPDPDTPLEETMGALDSIVRAGKALYIGLSNYRAEDTLRAIKILNQLGTPCLIHQPRYNMFDRWIEDGLTEVLEQEGKGAAVFSPLERGLLTNRYLDGIPSDSRVGRGVQFSPVISEDKIIKVRKLNKIAADRGQTMAQMAISWVLRLPQVTSAIIGASRIEQIMDGIKALKHLSFNEDELNEIEKILKG